jgi:hypothetical protein
MEVTETYDFACNGIVINDIFEGYRDVAVNAPLHHRVLELVHEFSVGYV